MNLPGLPDSLPVDPWALGLLLLLAIAAIAIVRRRSPRTSMRGAPNASAPEVVAPIGRLWAMTEIERSDGAHRIDATIRKKAQGFELEWRETAASGCSLAVLRFASMAELEAYLESRTPLRIGNFMVG